MKIGNDIKNGNEINMEFSEENQQITNKHM